MIVLRGTTCGVILDSWTGSLHLGGFSETPFSRVCVCVCVCAPPITKTGGPCQTLGESPGRDKPRWWERGGLAAASIRRA